MVSVRIEGKGQGPFIAGWSRQIDPFHHLNYTVAAVNLP